MRIPESIAKFTSQWIDYQLNVFCCAFSLSSNLMFWGGRMRYRFSIHNSGWISISRNWRQISPLLHVNWPFSVFCAKTRLKFVRNFLRLFLETCFMIYGSPISSGVCREENGDSVYLGKIWLPGQCWILLIWPTN